MIGELDLIAESISRCATRGHVLVVGAFPSAATREFLKSGWKLTVASTVEGVTGGSARGVSAEGPQIRRLEFDDLASIPDASFDIVWCSGFIERYANVGAALAEFQRVLRSGGRLHLVVPPVERVATTGQIAPGWTIGFLAHFLLASGYDAANGCFVLHGDCIFADVGTRHHRHTSGPQGSGLPDVENGNLRAWNWAWNTHPKELRPARLPRIRDAVTRLNLSIIVPWITKSRGGTENVGQMMVNAMAGRGHRVQLLTFDDKRQPPRWPIHNSVELRHLPEHNAFEKQMAVDIARFDPDAIVGLHLNSTFSKYVSVARKLDVPIVLSEHIDPRFPAMIGKFDPRERDVIFSGATKIHLLSEAFRSTLPDYLSNRIRVIANTCEEPKIKSNPRDVSLGGVVLTVARLVPRKNMGALIRAFAGAVSSNPGWKLRLVGDGPERKELEAFARSMGVASLVEFVGHTEQVEQYYQGANLFVLPSLFEGFPMSALEAMSYGLPLIGYRACNGINHQIEHGVNGFLSNGGSSLGSLTEDLRTLMSDGDLRERMGRKSIERFREQFSPEVIHRQWEDLFYEASRSQDCNARPSLARVYEAKLDEIIWGATDVSNL